MSTIQCGKTTYHLRQPAQGYFTRTTDDSGGGEFLVEGLPRPITGTGRRPQEAHREWKRQFHATFQRLFVMRPFEMEDADRRVWTAIETMVDVERYRADQPLIVRQIGMVCRARPYPLAVKWEDGTKERVYLERMPGEFATYKAGQPFEAVIHRHPVTHKIMSVEYIKRISQMAIKTTESDDLWNSVPTSAALPDADWD
ncbi:MAG: hypothetical protein K8U57_30980 [Planctomycetes bacterium]|nr:hypothetical protein [Planctomycetota bacterium]